ncbi:HD domain containing protein 2 [Fasciola gigantica]|uniref:5'-deoxynucleotidase HDDC2 n=1 Tax=Fasciola gigantica TaxID=46835 RepID=A0A504YUB5_FASGI|nr:HD domain containing protein 2 [Fasciola gigantica]
MSGVTVAKNVARVGIVAGAAYYSLQEGVWSTSDESVNPMKKVKQQLIPSAFNFFEERTVRTGWTRYEIDQPESVSDHMYRMALMTTVIPVQERESISVDRLLKMTVVHDLAECIVGDITPHCNVSREEKLRRETEAMDRLCQLIPKENAEEILLLWQEYNTQSTPEAVLCKDFDKFEMLVQAFEYEKEMCKPNKLSEFFESTLGE